MKILIVDDEKIIRKVLVRILKKSNCQIEIAENGKAALKKMSKCQFDLIMLDILMPEMNGIQFMKEIKKIGCKSKIIIISACHDNALIQQVRDQGALGYLKKPFTDINQILSAIEKVSFSK